MIFNLKFYLSWSRIEIIGVVFLKKILIFLVYIHRKACEHETSLTRDPAVDQIEKSLFLDNTTGVIWSITNALRQNS
jgi:hypothetical protein